MECKASNNSLEKSKSSRLRFLSVLSLVTFPMNRTDVVIKPSLFSTSFSPNASDGLDLTKNGVFYQQKYCKEGFQKRGKSEEQPSKTLEKLR